MLDERFRTLDAVLAFLMFFKSNPSLWMDIFCDWIFQPRKPRVKNSVFWSATALSRAPLAACNGAIAIFSAMAGRSRHRSRSHNEATEGEILYEDPFFFDTDFFFRARLAAFTFAYDGYTKFELGGRFELTRKITKYDEVGLTVAARHVKITDSEIKPTFLLGSKDYVVNTVGLTNTLDMRQSPYVNPRGILIKNTVDLAPSAFGSDIEYVRSTMAVTYYLPFSPKVTTPGVTEDQAGTPLQRWFQQSSLAFGARAGIIHSLTTSGPGEATAIPIDERFFNGGADTVRSFGERELGPHDNHGHPVGGEFFTVFNIEYTFPILGELQGAIFTDAGNLLPTSEDVGLNDMRYAVGAGLRYKLPVGPIRLDYGVNPDPRPFEDFGAFHFSFGFAF